MKKRYLIIAALSLTLVSGCGTKEPTTTQTTTEATTESPYTNENDKIIASLASDNPPSFSWLNSFEITEKDDTIYLTANVKWGDEYITACKFLTSKIKNADYFGKAALFVDFETKSTWFSWLTTASDNYEKGMLNTSNIDEPIFDVTIEDLEEAFKENSTTEEGD